MQGDMRRRTEGASVETELRLGLQVALSNAKLAVRELSDHAPVAFRHGALDAIGMNREPAETDGSAEHSKPADTREY